MQLVNIVIIGILVILSAIIIYFKIKKIKEKGFGCDCGCESCSSRTNCSISEKEE